MKLKLFFISVLSLFLFKCEDDKATSEGEESNNKPKKSIITEEAIESFEYTDYVLSTEGETAVSDWDKYQELSIQINYLRKADISFFNGDKELLQKFVQEFRLGIPKDLKTNPIISRVAIIETAILRFSDNLTLDNIPDQDKLNSVKEVLVAFSNLNYQINKKLERDKFDKIQSEY